MPNKTPGGLPGSRHNRFTIMLNDKELADIKAAANGPVSGWARDVLAREAGIRARLLADARLHGRSADKIFRGERYD